MPNHTIITVDADNFEQHGLFCVKNKKHPGYLAKRDWLQQRFAEGLRLKLLLIKDKQAGFLEYIPAEFTWRVVEAREYFVIHCLWVNTHQFGVSGLASVLLQDCERDAITKDANGIAVVTSDGPWMADKRVYLKNGFRHVDETAPHFQLLAKTFRDTPLPAFPKNWQERLAAIRGLQLLYTQQCPFIGKAVLALPPVAEQHGVTLKLMEMPDAATARKQMPSPYGMFNLVHDGRLLADHPISATRFRNILQKNLNLKLGN